jgi:type II secretory pathway component PulF
MSERTAGQRGGLSLNDLIALNDEIAALTRSGLPLERGLMGAGGDLPGRLGSIARGLGARMERGESLGQALESEGPSVPPTYRAVVEAGIRSGRLAEALEGLAGFARSYVDLRRAIGLALLYPLLVVIVGYGMFVLLVVELAPRLAEAFTSMRVPIGGFIGVLSKIGDSVWIWGPILPAFVLMGLIAWWRTGRTSAFRPGQVGLGMRWVPGLSSILDKATAAQFADWLALLIEHDVPWAEAVTLAAEATGDRRMIASAAAISQSSLQGISPAETIRDSHGIPPLLAWLMGLGGDQEVMASALRHAAETYRRRALRQSAALSIALPSILIVCLGTAATLFYVMALFAPWTSLLRGMTRQH